MPDLVDVDSLTSPPVVGRTYLVRAVRQVVGAAELWIPVHGPLHEDADLIGAGTGAAQLHYHYHHAFLPTAIAAAMRVDKGNYELYRRLRWLAEVFPGVEQRLAGEMLSMILVFDAAVMAPPVLHPMRCLRRLPRYGEFNIADWLGRMEVVYGNARVKCGLCPHRGLPLGSVPAGRDGVRTCPGHGLRWSREGRLVPRTAAELRRLGVPIEEQFTESHRIAASAERACGDGGTGDG